MPDILVPIIFGWPAFILSLLLSVGGIVWRKPWLLVIGAIIAAPFCWYLSLYPSLGAQTVFLPLFQIASAWVLRRGNRALAWVLLIPLAATGAFLAVVVLTQPRP